MDFSWLVKQLRNQKSVFSALLSSREQLLLKFSDRHVIDSDSELMQSLDDSESDLLDEYHKKNDTDSVSVNDSLLKILRQKRKKKCAMTKMVD